MRRLAVLLMLGLAACRGDRAPEAPEMSQEDVAAQLASIRIEPGLWELKSEVVDVRADSLPAEVRRRMIGPRSETRHCITPEQAAEPSANFLAGRSDSQCNYRDFRVEDGVVSGLMECPDAKAVMRGRYQPEEYQTEMDMESDAGAGLMRLKVRATGRRVGECGEEAS